MWVSPFRERQGGWQGGGLPFDSSPSGTVGASSASSRPGLAVPQALPKGEKGPFLPWASGKGGKAASTRGTAPYKPAVEQATSEARPQRWNCCSPPGFAQQQEPSRGCLHCSPKPSVAPQLPWQPLFMPVTASAAPDHQPDLYQQRERCGGGSLGSPLVAPEDTPLWTPGAVGGSGAAVQRGSGWWVLELTVFW